MAEDQGAGKPWTFLTNHARVLIRIAQNPDLRVRDLADLIGITERTTLQILADLEEAGYLSRGRIGRRNTYTVAAHAPLRHPADANADVAALIALFRDIDDHEAHSVTGPHPLRPSW